MSNFSINLQVHSDYAEQVDEAALTQAAKQTLVTAQADAPAGLSVVVTDEQSVQSLNNQFRDIDMPTDVLSFPADADPHAHDPDEPPYLGDILMAFPVAEQQAGESGHSTDEELRFLTVHGVLHLLGYDHHTPEEQAEMWALQSMILDALRESTQ